MHTKSKVAGSPYRDRSRCHRDRYGDAIGALLDGDPDTVRRDISNVKTACGDHLLKVILETCLIHGAAKRAACRPAREVGLDFVKTSTGLAVEKQANIGMTLFIRVATTGASQPDIDFGDLAIG